MNGEPVQARSESGRYAACRQGRPGSISIHAIFSSIFRRPILSTAASFVDFMRISGSDPGRQIRVDCACHRRCAVSSTHCPSPTAGAGGTAAGGVETRTLRTSPAAAKEPARTTEPGSGRSGRHGWAPSGHQAANRARDRAGARRQASRV
jgi:hypothetical protein